MHRFDVKRSKMLSYVANHSKPLNYKSDHNYDELHAIWHQNEQKWSSYVAKHSKQRKTTNWSKYNDLHRFDVKTSKNYELRLKTFKTTQTYESDQIIMNCIDLTSKRSKMLSYVAKHSKQRKTTKVIKL